MPLIDARLIASIAATVIALACGTNYVYSAWAPQFSDRLKLSATQSNLIGLFGNLGMYAIGIPVGIFIDARGPRLAVIAGGLCLGLGYYPLMRAYDRGEGSVASLCFFSLLTGFGGCMAFAAAVKTSALNWPHHRGTATAFPLAAFGLSAFFFATVGAAVAPRDTGSFLRLLSYGTPAMILGSFFFLRVLSDGPQDPDHAAGASRTGEDGKVYARLDDLGTSEDAAAPAVASSSTALLAPVDDVDVDCEPLADGIPVQSSVDLELSHRVDIRGLAMLGTRDFWQLFSIMGILTGIGLMTINNIGNNVSALWRAWEKEVSPEYIIQQQHLHVSILSLCSFAGRLLSGVGSDYLVRQLHASRIWCLVISSCLFLLAQIFAMFVTNPSFIWLVSGLSGIAYGMLFGVFPSIVAETFGIHGLSQNWGFITLAPVFSSNIFNLLYGVAYDAKSHRDETGNRTCDLGIECYLQAYRMTTAACLVGVAVSVFVVRGQRRGEVKNAQV